MNTAEEGGGAGTQEEVQIPRSTQYYVLNREKEIQKKRERYNSDPEVIRKREEREAKEAAKEAEKEAKKAEREKRNQEKLAQVLKATEGARDQPKIKNSPTYIRMSTPAYVPLEAFEQLQKMVYELTFKLMDGMMETNKLIRRISVLEERLSIEHIDIPQNEIVQTVIEPQNEIVQTVIEPHNDPKRVGFDLEELIHNAVAALSSDIKCYRENDIRTLLNDTTLNGVDHLFMKDKKIILIQDKWHESNTAQKQVSQFMQGIKRIKDRMASNNILYDDFTLIWASKHCPTKGSLDILTENNVYIFNCPTTIYDLARIIVQQVAAEFDVNPISGMLTIPVIKLQEKTLPKSSLKVTYDCSAEGLTAILEMTSFIEKELVQKIYGHIDKLMTREVVNYHSIINSSFPKTLDDWTSGKFSKVDFNKLLHSLATIDSHDPAKCIFHIKSLDYFTVYCKMRYISTLLADIALLYMNKRNTLIDNKSEWAKGLPTLKCKPEPMTEGQYIEYLRYLNEYCYASLQSFLYNCIKDNPGKYVTFQEILRAYRQWYSDEGSSSGAKRYNDNDLRKHVIACYGEPVIIGNQECFKDIIVFECKEDADKFDGINTKYRLPLHLNLEKEYEIRYTLI